MTALRLARPLLLLLVGWWAAWLYYGFLPNLFGPPKSSIGGEVRWEPSGGESSFTPQGYYVACGDLGGRVYLPDGASAFLGREVEAYGILHERCSPHRMGCFPAIETDVERGFLRPYEGPAPEQRATMAAEQATARSRTATAAADTATASVATAAARALTATAADRVATASAGAAAAAATSTSTVTPPWRRPYP